MDHSNTPLVSVIMPVYNGERFVVEAVMSILNQSYKNVELIIVNDGSTDNTPLLLQQIAADDKRIRLLTNPKPLGHAGEAAFNKATELARGTYIAKLDADDIAIPERIAVQVAYLNEHPDIFLAGSFLELIDEYGAKIGTRTYPTNPDVIFSEFYYRNCIGNPSIMYRNNVVAGGIYLLKNEVFTDDYYSFFIHMNNGHKFANIPRYLTQYRIHKSNTVFTDIRRKWAINVGVKKSFINDFGYYAPLNHRIKIGLITLAINTIPEKVLIKIMNQVRRILKA